MPDQLHRLSVALVDRYRIERVLGAGGMATVYVAEDLKHDRKVAVKVLRPEIPSTVGRQRFLAEIKLLSKLDHPLIVPLLESGEGEGVLYYVTPLVEGETLGERLRREGQLSIADALQIGRDVAEALSYLHEHRVLHRDIKPDNILLEGNRASVADFGLAEAVHASSEARLSSSGIATGTPEYMSPEQVIGESRLDGRTDVYSLGCVLYEMLAGEPPFTGSSPRAIIARRLTETPPALTTVRPEISDDIWISIKKALERAPADRYATAMQLLGSLTALLEELGGGDGPRGPEDPNLCKRLSKLLAHRYAIERTLAEGGMAVICLADDIRLERKVVIKVLRPELAAGLGRRRFRREIRLTARFRHANIVPLFDYDETGGLLYYVMPYFEEGCLRQRLLRDSRLAADDATKIAREVAEALHYAHKRKVVHRDIKPENILLDDGHASVTDFGIAKVIDAMAETSGTTPGHVVGTPPYMSPEQAAGERGLDARSDVFSLGCLVYEMLAGKPPVDGSTPQQVLSRRMAGSFQSLRSFQSSVPETLETAVVTALSLDPAERYATALAFRDALPEA